MLETICGHRYCSIVIVAPIARTLCDTAFAFRRSKFLSAYLFVISVLLTYASYKFGQDVTRALPDMLVELIKDTVTRLFAVYTFSFVVHVLLASAFFAVFRALALFVIYAAYTLGRNTVFWLSMLLLPAFAAFIIASDYAQLLDAPYEFVRRHAALVFASGMLLLLVVWFYGRYMRSYARDRKVFDHEVGAALAHMRRS